MRVKSDTRRQAIIDVASEVFKEHGFEAASMSGISAKLGGSKATLYNYFASKEELFVEVVRQFAEGHMRETYGILEVTPDGDLPALLQRFGESLVMALCQPDVVSSRRSLYSEAGKSGVGRLYYTRGPELGLQEASNFLQRCMDAGMLRQADSVVAAQHLVFLFKAEWEDQILLGVWEGLSGEQVKMMVARAVDVFLRSYAP